MAGKGWFGLPFFSLNPRPEVVSCVLSGGGSRASFQLGALDYLYRHDEQFTPTIFVGASAGSILASTLAQSADRDVQQEYLRLLRQRASGQFHGCSFFRTSTVRRPSSVGRLVR